MQDVSPTQATAPQPMPPRASGPRGRVSKFVIPDVIFGIGTLVEVGGAVRRVGGHRPMLISDPGVLAAGWVDRALPHLEPEGPPARSWAAGSGAACPAGQRRSRSRCGDAGGGQLIASAADPDGNITGLARNP